MKTVITFGTFDLFHIGHVNILRRAATFGERLVVGVSSDELNYAKKGFNPLFSLDDRMAIVASLRFVDEVFVERTLEDKRDYVQAHHADVLVMGDGWAGRFDELSDVCDVVYLPRTPDISSADVRRRLAYPL